MQALLLKVAATALTLVAAAAAALHVSANVKSAEAPLHPAVLTPSVRSGDVQAATSTYAS